MGTAGYWVMDDIPKDILALARTLQVYHDARRREGARVRRFLDVVALTSVAPSDTCQLVEDVGG